MAVYSIVSIYTEGSPASLHIFLFSEINPQLFLCHSSDGPEPATTVL